LGRLGRTLFDIGEYQEAAAALDEAIKLARQSGEAAAEASALMERARIRIWIDPEGATQEAREQAKAAIRLFEEVADERGLSQAWRLWSEFDVNLCQWERARDANERALSHARRAHDALEEAQALRSIAGDLMHDTTPIPEAIARCEEIYRELTAERLLQASVLVYLGVLCGMSGRTDEARVYLLRSQETLEDFGVATALGIMLKYAGNTELFAGDAVAAERQLRRGAAVLERIGERGHLSTVLALLSVAVYGQGRFEEAERLSETALDVGSTDDIATIVTALGVRAKVQLRKGHADAGEALVREALHLIEQTDMLWLRGLIWMDFAEFQGLAGRSEEAREAALTALALFEQKRASALSGRAQAFLSELVVAGGGSHESATPAGAPPAVDP
jgi:tetratricopeptide (TPR) repeat protein